MFCMHTKTSQTTIYKLCSIIVDSFANESRKKVVFNSSEKNKVSHKEFFINEEDLCVSCRESFF